MREEWKFAPENELSKSIIYHIVDIVILTGSKEPRATLQNTATASLDDRLSKIVKLTIMINQTIREEVASADLEATLVRPKSRFNPKTTDDVSTPPDKEQPRDGIVLCTTDLGLNQFIKRPGGGGGKEGEETASRWDGSILLKPKVILVSTVDPQASRDDGRGGERERGERDERGERRERGERSGGGGGGGGGGGERGERGERDERREHGDRRDRGERDERGEERRDHGDRGDDRGQRGQHREGGSGSHGDH
jgi:hypothetical protein